MHIYNYDEAKQGNNSIECKQLNTFKFLYMNPLCFKDDEEPYTKSPPIGLPLSQCGQPLLRHGVHLNRELPHQTYNNNTCSIERRDIMGNISWIIKFFLVIFIIYKAIIQPKSKLN